nr:hypothetical protein [uncultured Duganella sp.]
MDQQKLRALVFEKTGVKLDLDDPVFALVALNEAVLEEAVERHIARIDAASQALAAQVQAHAAGQAPAHDHHAAAPADHPAGYVPTPPSGPVRPISTQSPLITPRELRLLGAAAAIAIVSALIVLGGQAAFHKSGLSAEQEQALQRAARLEQAIQKLDPAVRAQLK